MTLDQKLLAGGGRPEGFDYMRLGLAVLIVVWHTCIVCYGAEAQTALALGPTRVLWAIILPMFFALSGFLVAGSLERSKTLITFLGLRGLRLVPALAVESAVSLVIIGGLLTELPKSEYFSSKETWGYLTNTLGFVKYYLPGVFQNNPSHAVNLQLWTLPWELRCYVIAAILFIIGALRSPRRLVISLVVLQVFGTWTFLRRGDPDVGVLTNWGLVLAFAYALALYRFRTWIPYRLDLGIAAGLISAVLLSFRETQTLAPAAVAYLTVYLGLKTPKLHWPLTTGDYSYPIFLYGFPIQQAMIAIFPWSNRWWMNLLLSALPIGVVSVFSWHYVEKPAQSARRWIVGLEKAWLTSCKRVLELFEKRLTKSVGPSLRSSE